MLNMLSDNVTRIYVDVCTGLVVKKYICIYLYKPSIKYATREKTTSLALAGIYDLLFVETLNVENWSSVFRFCSCL